MKAEVVSFRIRLHCRLNSSVIGPALLRYVLLALNSNGYLIWERIFEALLFFTLIRVPADRRRSPLKNPT